MSNRANDPGNRGGEATQDVASLLAGIALPSIERFGSDNDALAGLQGFIVAPVPDVEPPTQASVARSVVAAGVRGLAAVRSLENSLAACKAALVDRVLGAVAVESAATELTRYQSGLAESGCVAEIALALGIPERTAAALGAHATGLQDLPRTSSALSLGVLSWRHVCTILNELDTLAETPHVTAVQLAGFEAKLLLLAEGTTASRFAAKARRARESIFPESISTRTKEAFRRRKITNEPGKDGMNWVELHIPTIAANAIMVHCTRAARAIKADAKERQRDAESRGTGEDCHEYRTLDQLRADVAAILLMGQELPASAAYHSPKDGLAGMCNGASQSTSEGRPDCTSDRTSEGRPEANSEARCGSASQDAGVGVGGAVHDCGVSAAPSSLHDVVSTNAFWTDTDLSGSPASGATETEEEPPWAHTGPAKHHIEDQQGADSENHVAGDGSSTMPRGEALPGTTKVATNHSPNMSRGTEVKGEPLEGTVLGSKFGYVDGLVDGVVEDPHGERLEQEAYLAQLHLLSGNAILRDPPMPKALVLIKVPFLGLLGVTDEPAELDDSTAGPVPLDIARRLLAGSSTFLRVLTDPITGKALPMEPQRYTLRDAERSVLQALAGGCYFPNCTNPVVDSELDHVRSFSTGGRTTMDNLRPACKRHHGLKHFSDDKDRKGSLRRWAEPWRTGIRLHGWTPRLCSDGKVGWVSPSGTYRPPECTEPQRPAYPKWLMKRLNRALPVPVSIPATSGLSHSPDLASPLERSVITYLSSHS